MYLSLQLTLLFGSIERPMMLGEENYCAADLMCFIFYGFCDWVPAIGGLQKQLERL